MARRFPTLICIVSFQVVSVLICPFFALPVLVFIISLAPNLLPFLHLHVCMQPTRFPHLLYSLVSGGLTIITVYGEMVQRREETEVE